MVCGSYTDGTSQIYVVHALPKDYFVRTDGGIYDRSHYYEHPELYKTVFHERVCTSVIHCPLNLC